MLSRKISKLHVAPRESSPVAARLRAIVRELELLAREMEGGTTETHAPKLVENSTPRPVVKLLTASEVAERLGLNVQTVYEMIRTRQLPCIRFGRSVRVSTSALEKWLADRGASEAG